MIKCNELLHLTNGHLVYSADYGEQAGDVYVASHGCWLGDGIILML